MNMKTSSSSSCEGSEEYMLLSPKHAGSCDMMKLLFTKDIGKQFIDCPDGTSEQSFSWRFIVFFSFIAQRILHLLDKPLSWVGLAIEFIPNFKHMNGGFFNLLFNLLSGKLEVPKRDSSQFLSLLGLLDPRRDLDSKITHKDPRYTRALAVMAAKCAYENEAYIQDTVEKHWKMEFLGFLDCWNDYEEDYTTQGFMWSDKTGDSELICVSFRGTSPFNARDWSSDFDLSWYRLPGIGKVHGGFLKALGLQMRKGWPKDIQSDNHKPYAYYVVRQKLKERIESNPNAKFLLTGHSLGAALAVLFPAVLAHHEETQLLSKLEGVYTFGQPRVGDQEFGEYMTKILVTHGLRYHRFVYCNDFVPRVPFDHSNIYFKHFGVCHYCDSSYKCQVLAEEPYKNYFSVMAIIPRFANAFWELLRSFIICYQRGPEYHETKTCRFSRVMGLFFAGLSAHGPQDYVNLTRLGSFKLFSSSSPDQSTNGFN